jgi:hypothetical protein
MSSYGMTSPCGNCPFRTDIRAYLTSGRVREIERSLDRSEFPCHKTADHNDDGEYAPNGKEVHCAGALILLEKLERPSQMMRICERLGMYDAGKLDMDAPVFDSFDEMAAAQRNRQRRTGAGGEGKRGRGA